MGTTAFAGEIIRGQGEGTPRKQELLGSITRLIGWLEKNDYRGYDTFDGLNARLLRPFTFESETLRTVLQQGVRRFPWNIRPVIGVERSRSTKGMGFLARGFLRMYQATGDTHWEEEARKALQWLVENRSKGYSGACWGNHFDYQSRTFYLPKGVPTIVWTSLIGHAFIDAYELLKTQEYLEIVQSACEHIVRDFAHFPYGEAVCISYVPGLDSRVHNANTLGASLLARVYSHTGKQIYRTLALKALSYTASHQGKDGSWYYGEKENLRWVDNFHTAYVLDCFKHYSDAVGDDRFHPIIRNGYHYWKTTFFLPDGTPRYYNHKTLPIDIQCCSQAIDTLVFFRQFDEGSLDLAQKVAEWTITHMQDRDGHFYYRRYSSWLVNKTPTLHWGQATMLAALAALYRAL